MIALTLLQYATIKYLGYGDRLDWAKISFPGIAANLFYVVPFTNQQWLNGVLWTLSVEFQFYFFLAVAFPLLARRPMWLLMAGVASLGTSLLPYAKVALFLNYSIFFAMGGVALLYRQRYIDRAKTLAFLALMTMVAAIELGLLQSSFAAATALVIAFVSLRNRALIFLGKISYSLYLTHMLFATSSEFLLVRAFAPESLVERFALQLLCVFITIVGAWFFYLLVERHFVNWSQRVAGRDRLGAQHSIGARRASHQD